MGKGRHLSKIVGHQFSVPLPLNAGKKILPLPSACRIFETFASPPRKQMPPLLVKMYSSKWGVEFGGGVKKGWAEKTDNYPLQTDTDPSPAF